MNQQLDADEVGFEWCSEFESGIISIEHRIYSSDGQSEVVFHGSKSDWGSLCVAVVNETEKFAMTNFDDR